MIGDDDNGKVIRPTLPGIDALSRTFHIGGTALIVTEFLHSFDHAGHNPFRNPDLFLIDFQGCDSLVSALGVLRTLISRQAAKKKSPAGKGGAEKSGAYSHFLWCAAAFLLPA